MNHEFLEFCNEDIQTLLEMKLISQSKSQCSCATFYAMNQAEKKGILRLVLIINYLLRYCNG